MELEQWQAAEAALEVACERISRLLTLHARCSPLGAARWGNAPLVERYGPRVVISPAMLRSSNSRCSPLGAARLLQHPTSTGAIPAGALPPEEMLLSLRARCLERISSAAGNAYQVI